MRGGYWRAQFWQWDGFTSFNGDMADFAFVMDRPAPRSVFTPDDFDAARRDPPVLVTEVDRLPGVAVDAESFVFPAPREALAERMMFTYRGLEVFAPEASLTEATSAWNGATDFVASDDLGGIPEASLPPADWILGG